MDAMLSEFNNNVNFDNQSDRALDWTDLNTIRHYLLLLQNNCTLDVTEDKLIKGRKCINQDKLDIFNMSQSNIYFLIRY